MSNEITDSELQQRITSLLDATAPQNQAQQLQEMVALLRQGNLTPEQSAKLVSALHMVHGNWPAPADTRYF
ncbi:hypothetical protein D3C78_1838750 [compost metagenome]